MENLVVVIVLYKPKLDDFERKNIILMYNYLSEYKWYLIIPENRKVEILYDERVVMKIIRLRESFFQSIKGYNQLLLSSKFYQLFSKTSKYILIVQPDVTIVKKFDKNLLHKDIIYYGARWRYPLQLYPIFGRKFSGLFNRLGLARFSQFRLVGNGGLSIRRVMDFVESCSKFHARIWMDSEDLYFAYQWELRFLIEDPLLKDYFLEYQARDRKQVEFEFGYHALNINNPELLALIFENSKDFFKNYF